MVLKNGSSFVNAASIGAIPIVFIYVHLKATVNHHGRKTILSCRTRGLPGKNDCRPSSTAVHRFSVDINRTRSLNSLFIYLRSIKNVQYFRSIYFYSAANL